MIRYGISTPAKGPTAELLLEFEAIRRGGKWEGKGEAQGLGLFEHYLNAHKLLWPEDPQHRWFKLGLTGIVNNKICCLLGCASSAKTYLMAVHALIDFFVFPKTSLALISTTDIRSLELRIWGRGVKYLFNRAKEKFPWLPGYILEAKMSIVPNPIETDGERGREINLGLCCVPCVSGGKFVGMAKFQGIKPPSSPGKNDGILKHYGDEASAMESAFLDAYTNWTVSQNFKGVMGGNPTDTSDPLCIASEPIGGWESFVDDKKTQVWKSKWYNAHCIAFDGRDTPNNDEPKNRYPFLASAKFYCEQVATHGADSWQVYQMAIGKPSRGMVSNRVITIGLCEKHHAFDDVVWVGKARTKIIHLDPAYGGGDRCVLTISEFGEGADGNQYFSAGEPEIIPINPNGVDEPEDQIARYVFRKSESLAIPASQIFYDSFGRGTLGFSFAKLFGASCPVPVDSGAQPTERPVRFDLYIQEKDGKRRLKTCREHYSKFVTEMWFSVRELIESGQMRNLPKSVAMEGQLRLFSVVKGNKVEIETKADMKERIRKSPDLMDCACIGAEGARQLGFEIKRIGSSVEGREKPEENYFANEAKAWEDAMKSGLLKR